MESPSDPAQSANSATDAFTHNVSLNFSENVNFLKYNTISAEIQEKKKFFLQFFLKTGTGPAEEASISESHL
jgi:hypothetical protein